MTVDVLVIGAGPAGLAAATTCAQHALSTMLVDEQPSPGGQVYRGVAEAPLARRNILGHDFAAGASLVDAFMRCGAGYSPGTTVWSIARRAMAGSTSRFASRANRGSCMRAPS